MLELAKQFLNEKNMYVLLLALAFWMYKEARSDRQERQKNLATRLEKAFEAYGALLTLLGARANGAGVKLTDFDSTFGKASVFMGSSLIDAYNQWRSQPNPLSDYEGIATLIQLVREEMSRLKRLQTDPISYKPGATPSGWLEWIFRTELQPYLQPLLIVFLNLVFLGVATSGVLSFVASTTSMRSYFTYFASAVALTSWASALLFSSDFVFEREHRDNAASWVLVGGCLAVGAAVFYWHFYMWQLLLLVLSFVYIYLFRRFVLLRRPRSAR